MKTNDVLDGVTIKINELFGDDYEIYTNNVKQDLQMPCFYIDEINDNRKRLVGKRLSNDINYAIYAILEDPKQEELNDIKDKLYNLEYIKLLNGDLLRGTDMRGEINDDVLIFFVTYNFHLIEVTEQTNSMDSISIEGGVKENE